MSSTQFMHLVSLLPIWAVVVAAVVGLIRFRRLSQPLRYLALLVSFDALVELTVLALRVLFPALANLFLLPLISLGEVALLALAYRSALQSAPFSRIMPWVVGSFGIYALVGSWVAFHRVHYPAAIQITADLLQFCLAALYFWKLLRELRVEHLHQDPFFWVSVGLVVFVLGDLFIMLFSNYLLAHYSVGLQRLVLGLVRQCFLITLYCCYSLALWMRPPNTNSLSS